MNLRKKFLQRHIEGQKVKRNRKPNALGTGDTKSRFKTLSVIQGSPVWVGNSMQVVEKRVSTFGMDSTEVYEPSRDEDNQYETTDTINAKIIDVGAQKITCKCLIDETNKSIEIRKFDREPLEGAVTLEINQFLEIVVYTKPGERRFVYKQIDGESIRHLFEPQDLLEELVGSPIFKAMPPVDEGDI